jgi:hypothetical protein
MQNYNRLVTPRFRRITLRISFIEIELRTRIPAPQERPTAEERAYRWARAEEALCRGREKQLARWALGL